MTRAIVTTTINPPTKAIELFDAMPDWHLIVVGDLKTPENYRLENGTYLSPEDQERMDKTLSDLIGWKCIQRRSFGFLLAHEMGAEVVATIDDDNIPYEGWGQGVFVNQDVEVNYYDTDLPAFDPIGATNHPHLWHRGYPLQLLPSRDYSSCTKRVVHCDVQADFWDGDPDIDAICRMQFAPDCRFDPGPFPMAASAVAPFNSQNTFVSGAWLRDYFMFPHVGRMDDIWSAYYVQARGGSVVFGKASVFQERNPHDLIVDMKKEYLGYENNLAVVESIAGDAEALFKFLPPESIAAFDQYRSHF